jgi:hypothetical protein
MHPGCGFQRKIQRKLAICCRCELYGWTGTNCKVGKLDSSINADIKKYLYFDCLNLNAQDER